MITEDRIYSAFQGKIDAIEALSTCIEEIAKLKAERARKLSEAVANGLYAECKNEDARKAAATIAMADIDAQIAAWEDKERQARCTFDVACEDVRMVEALLKLYAIPK